MTNLTIRLVTAMAGSTLLLCGLSRADDLDEKSDPDTVRKVLEASFSGNAMAGLDRLQQTQAQKLCSANFTEPVDAKTLTAMQADLMAQVQYPADGQFLGDWKNGRKLAASGAGMTWADKPGSQAYGNCYACHQLETAELSFGNIGPSLNNYGKQRGNAPEMLKYTWARLWNSHAFNLCNAMPSFGANGILSESDLKDLMALLHDPASVVNE